VDRGSTEAASGPSDAFPAAPVLELPLRPAPVPSVLGVAAALLKSPPQVVDGMAAAAAATAAVAMDRSVVLALCTTAARLMAGRLLPAAACTAPLRLLADAAWVMAAAAAVAADGDIVGGRVETPRAAVAPSMPGLNMADIVRMDDSLRGQPWNSPSILATAVSIARQQVCFPLPVGWHADSMNDIDL
jgi:hypothetical protein